MWLEHANIREQHLNMGLATKASRMYASEVTDLVGINVVKGK